MDIFQKIIMLFLIVGLAGCSQEFVIEENTNAVVENISNNSETRNLEKEEEIQETVYTELEENNENRESNSSNIELERLIFSNSLNTLEFEVGKEYNLEVETQENIYSYSFLVEENDEEYDAYINGVNIPTSILSVYFNIENKELSFEKISNNQVKLSFKEKDIIFNDYVEENEIELEVNVEDNLIELEWEDNLENVKWYKVMHSTYNSNPKYPQDNAIGVIEKGKNQEFEHWTPSIGTNYYRISIVLEDDSVLHSEVIEVDFEYEDDKKK